MKKRGYLGNFTLLKISKDSGEQDLNHIEAVDYVLSAENIERGNQDEHANKAEKGHSTEKRIKELCNEVENLTVSTNWEPVKNRFEAAKKEIEVIDPENIYETLHSVFEKYYTKFERRYNNHLEVKKTIDVKENLCEELEKLSDSNDYESAIKRFNEIKKEWSDSKEIPERFEEVLEKKYNKLAVLFLDKLENIRNRAKSHNSVKNILEQCCDSAEKFFVESDMSKAISEFKKIENKWKETIEESVEFETLKKRYEAALNLFNVKKKEYLDKLEKNKAETEIKAKEIITQIEACLKEKKTKNVLHKVKGLQLEWDKLEISILEKELVRTFSKITKRYFSKLKFIQQKEDWARWENYTNKLLLCERAEKLLLEKDTFKVAREIKEIWEKWRKIGQAPRDKNDEIWERFNKTRQILKNRCNEFFTDLKAERGANTEKKKALCEKAEELSTSDDWETTAEELKNIQIEWKSIGPAVKEIDDSLYERFRNACNKFFENRIEFYKYLHQKQAVNKNSKRELIDEAETLKDLPWKEAIKKIKRLRIQWKKFGSANRQDEQKLWSRFNNIIESYLEDLDKSRPQNLAKKEEICCRISSLIKNLKCNSEANENINEQIELLKSEWKEAGPVPYEEENNIFGRYDDLINELSDCYQKLLEKKAVELTSNRKVKEELLFKIEDLVENGFTDEIKEKYNEICKNWNNLSINNLDVYEERLNQRFNEVCDAFVKEDDNYFSLLKSRKAENFKNKIKICIELEKLANISTSNDVFERDKNDNLAAELMFAIKGNFASDKKHQSEDDVYAKFKKLQGKWLEIGPVPIEDFESLNLRYSKACSNLEAKFK